MRGRTPTSSGRRWAIGFVVGTVFGLGVLVFGTLAVPLGVVAIALLVWEPGRTAPVGGCLMGSAASWLLLLSRAGLRCGPDRPACLSPDLGPWLTASLVALALGAILSVRAFRRPSPQA